LIKFTPFYSFFFSIKNLDFFGLYLGLNSGPHPCWASTLTLFALVKFQEASLIFAQGSPQTWSYLLWPCIPPHRAYWLGWGLTKLFSLSWPQRMILPISACRVAEITGVSYHVSLKQFFMVFTILLLCMKYFNHIYPPPQTPPKQSPVLHISHFLSVLGLDSAYDREYMVFAFLNFIYYT
jgi:hypothetical protein